MHFFFFQAEDGIRDLIVTGVQTCALPICQEGMDVIREARVIFDNYQIATEILAASIRHPRHVVEAAMIGADVATLPPDVLKKLLLHPLTDRGLEQFLADWSTLAARAKASV